MWCIGNGQLHQSMSEVVGALNCMHDQQIVLVGGSMADHRITPYGGGETSQTLDASYFKGAGTRNGKEREILAVEDVTETIVRRLTPLECERLQGYPDYWTDIGEWIDSKGKKHKEADSPRYKALGNSIALPFWEWMAKRMVDQLGKENPTMGSLFSGIGGFELVYARAGAEPVWESEIEEFCIAVSKKHFGDSETGEKGDYEQYL